MTEANTRSIRPEPHRLPPHRRSADRPLQLGVRAPPRRHVRPAHRRHRPRALHRREHRGDPPRACAGSDSTGTRAPRSAATTARTSRRSASTATPSCSRHSRPAATPTRASARRGARGEARRGPRPTAASPATTAPAAASTRPTAAARIAAGEPHVWRLTVPEDRGDIVVRRRGPRRAGLPADAVDDFVLARTDGSPTYNFAVVVDDVDMEITHVIRGDDHLTNTPKQIVVYEALGLPSPRLRAPVDDPGRRRQAALQAPRRDQRRGLPRPGLPARGAAELPRAARLVARRRDDRHSTRRRCARTSRSTASPRTPRSSTTRSSSG